MRTTNSVHMVSHDIPYQEPLFWSLKGRHVAKLAGGPCHTDAIDVKPVPAKISN